MNTSLGSFTQSEKSAFSEIRSIGLKTILFTVCVLTGIWVIVSIYGMRSLIESRKAFLSTMIESHQEEIVSGQFRSFIEGVRRDKIAEFSSLSICWGEGGDNCEHAQFSIPKLFTYSINIPIYAGNSIVATVHGKATLHTMVIQSGLVLFSFAFTIFFLFFSMKRFILTEQRARNVLAKAVLLTAQGNTAENLTDLPTEIRPLAQALLKSVADLQKTQIESAGVKARGDLASQVAHDIRSPLAALDVALTELGQLPEETRILVREATQRIRDIANNLLARSNVNHSEAEIPEANLSCPVSTHHIASLIEAIVSEKRVLYSSRPEIRIEFLSQVESYGLFAQIEPVEFKRILSNLINNSVDAINSSGKVEVSLTHEQNNLKISVKDDGCGMDEVTISKLGTRGFSRRKLNNESGSGLGLYHAKICLKLWRGWLEVKSALGRGTIVSLMLPRAKTPSWFVESITLKKGRIVAVVDDDSSIHRVWENRFKCVDIKLVHLYSIGELSSWVQNHDANLYLVDFEFTGSHQTGIEIIKHLDLIERSFLVTSRYEEDIIQRCEALNIALIPKSLASIIPVIEC